MQSNLALHRNPLKRQSIMLKYYFLILMLMEPLNVLAQPFELPIGGTPFKDWVPRNYVDQDPGPGIKDWNNGVYTYNGHTGIDFQIRGFSSMDEGVDVYAAEAGKVINIQDGNFDRWSRFKPFSKDPPSNFVIVRHKSGVTTEYWHLKKNSISVTKGQQVSAGEKLGLVGSSGISNGPHLHFTVRDANGIIVTTYNQPEKWWLKPLPHPTDAPGILDHGITHSDPSIADIQNRPEEHRVFLQTQLDGARVVYWWKGFGASEGDTLEYIFRTPSGIDYEQGSYDTPEYRNYYQYRHLALPPNSETGVWTLEVRQQGVLLFEDWFVIASAKTQ